MLALALARYHAAVALGLALLGDPGRRPGPSDAVFGWSSRSRCASGRFRLRAAPRPVVVILTVFGALNVMAAIQVADPGRAALFFAITVFLAAFGLWLPGLRGERAARARLIVRGYLVAAVIASCLGVLALLGPMPGYDLLTEGDRARALFQDPNVFGPFLIPPALILVEEILRPRVLARPAADQARAARHPAGRRPVLLFARRVAEPRGSACWCWALVLCLRGERRGRCSRSRR